jgi:hypothetical protein
MANAMSLIYFSFILLYHKIKGLVAQWTRARGYGLRCRGFESLLAHFYFSLKPLDAGQILSVSKK